MTSPRKIGRNVEGGGCVVIHRNVAAFAWRERRKQDSQFLGRSLDPRPPEYEVGMLSIDRDIRCRLKNSAKPESSRGGILAHSVCLSVWFLKCAARSLRRADEKVRFFESN
jgi:hypothetical protein